MTGKIEDYALIGDCQTAALVGRDGSIDWLCWPRFDSGACFARLLGNEENGRWLLAPTDPNVKITRSYRGRTPILETRYENADSAALVIDFLADYLPEGHLVRIVQGLRGTMTFRTELIIRMNYGAAIPWVKRNDDNSLHAVSGPDGLILRTGVTLDPEAGRKHGAIFTIAAGDTKDFVIGYHLSYQEIAPEIQSAKALAHTERAWERWAEAYTDEVGPYSAAVIRSLITLRALIFEPSGGIVAAPTTSLPEALGGGRNWDYRYCWLRDATFTLFALMNGGFLEEARRWRAWLLRAIGGDPTQIQIMYGIGGEQRLPEFTVPELAGYEGSRPVRVGNAAAGQLQIDIYGELLDAFYQARKRGLVADDADWMVQHQLLAHLETLWTEPDEGIWEVRGPPRHFVYSKIMAWVAFDRAIKTVEEFGLPGPLEKWKTLRQTMHDDICDKGWNAEIGAFTQAYGSSAMDASILLIALVGFLPPSDSRVRRTVEAVEKYLLKDGFVIRYETEKGDDGLEGTEGAFLACSFWYVDNLVLLGRRDEAHAFFERLVSLSTDLGLLSEEYDTREKRLVGNFPQAFSHIALVNSAYNLARNKAPAEERSGHRAGPGQS
jgi:GH15 family glucan-1,4-alpha-glucosidase